MKSRSSGNESYCLLCCLLKSRSSGSASSPNAPFVACLHAHVCPCTSAYRLCMSARACMHVACALFAPALIKSRSSGISVFYGRLAAGGCSCARARYHVVALRMPRIFFLHFCCAPPGALARQSGSVPSHALSPARRFLFAARNTYQVGPRVNALQRECGCVSSFFRSSADPRG